MALIRGDLASAGVPELFRAIADERRTGSLTLTRPGDGNGTRDAEAAIFFRAGDAYTARLTGTGIRLGDRLISAGLVSKEDVDQALNIQRAESGGRRLGQVLLDFRLIKQEQLSTIVRQQIEDTIFEILRWDGGEFAFRSDITSEEDIAIEISVENLVMEGARRFREWHEITRRVPTLESIPSFKEDGDGAVEVALTPEEWSFVSRVDGRHTIKELALACGFTDLEAGRTVFGLVTAGLLSLELPSGVELPPEVPDIEAAFDELERALHEASRERSEGSPKLRLEQFGRVEEVSDAEEPELPEIASSEPESLGAEVEELQAQTAMTEPELIEEPSEETSQLPAEEEAEEIHMVEAGSNVIDADLDHKHGDVIELVAPQPQVEAASEVDMPVGEAEMHEPEPELIEPASAQHAEPEVAFAEPEPEVAFAEPEPEVAFAEPEPEVAFAEPEPEVLEVEEIDLEAPAVTDWDQAPREGDSQSKTLEILAASEELAKTNMELDGDAASEEVRWGIVAPPANGQAAVLEEPAPIHIVAEEPQARTSQPEPTYARMFAELSAPIKDAETAPEVPKYAPAPEPQETIVSESRFPAIRPVDPMVDTTSLIREFSALGLEDEGLAISGDGDRDEQVRPGDEKGKGFFGRRKR